ncbi:galectin-4 isoform X2 [Anoplophora glabripennis]|uniref:galectin-4 isoform X2 n=1 Tax=Anoplophora glabripennis TaxID=217634 RepID=UPI000874C941|nr:galectin-4 isoform X2 [Anoplophora glabripennis]
MPEISKHKRKNVDRRKSGCGACSCCFFPRKKVKEGHLEARNESLVKSSHPVILEKPPHIEDLPAPLKAGSCIRFNGYVRPECTRFAVNLLCGKTKESDIAVHINPRISQRHVVRNTRIQGKWGDEETTSIAKFDLHRNKKFAIDIVVTESEFLVSINGKHVCAFVFRLPISKITTLMVDGEVDVEDVQYTKLEIYPHIGPQNAPYVVPTGDGQNKDTVQQLDVPVTATLPKGFQKNWQLEICGRVKILPSAFYINLQKGSQLWPHPIIPLHLNPRFNTLAFVRNAWLGGKWGKEECSPAFPFGPGETFNVAIRKNDDHFSVWVDGKLAGEFKFRGPVDQIDSLYIHGDVVVKTLYMREHIDDKYFSKSQENLKPMPL